MAAIVAMPAVTTCKRVSSQYPPTIEKTALAKKTNAQAAQKTGC
jgi:hypothetical protein